MRQPVDESGSICPVAPDLGIQLVRNLTAPLAMRTWSFETAVQRFSVTWSLRLYPLCGILRVSQLGADIL